MSATVPHHCHLPVLDDALDNMSEYDWNCEHDEDTVATVDVKPVEVQGSKRGKKPRATKRQRTTAASTDDHSDTLSRIHATIQSLIAGEKIVQQTKAHTLTRLADTLANYDSMVDDVIRGINDTRVRVKGEERRGRIQPAAP